MVLYEFRFYSDTNWIPPPTSQNNRGVYLSGLNREDIYLYDFHLHVIIICEINSTITSPDGGVYSYLGQSITWFPPQYWYWY